MEKKAQNSEDEDPWVQYDLLKQRLKRLRVRFYNGRGADKERTARLRPIWYERQKEVLEDLITAAINDANKKISENTNSQLGSISSGMGLPPGMKLPF